MWAEALDFVKGQTLHVNQPKQLSHSCGLEQDSSLRTRKTLFFRTGEIEFNIKRCERRFRIPRASLLQRHPTTMCLQRGGGHATEDRAANAFAVDCLKLIANHTESAGLKLINVPQVTSATMFLKSQ